MYRTSACPACGSEAHDAWPAILAPFVAERALREAPSAARLLQCRACGLRFFDVRLDDDEIARLYDGYRDERYLRERHRHEPWYGRRANDRLGRSAREIEARRGALTRYLRAHVDVARIDRVLDFGGDRGQFLPEGIGRTRAVFDVSGVAPIAGVEGIADEAALAGRRFDLVLLAHVLEHASEPRALLERARGLLDDGGLLYVEVPRERPRLDVLLRGPIGERWLALLLGAPRALRAFDFYSTAIRLALHVVPPLGFLKAHEHLNFFEARSLGSALRAAGLSPIALDEGHGLVRAIARATP